MSRGIVDSICDAYLWQLNLWEEYRERKVFYIMMLLLHIPVNKYSILFTSISEFQDNFFDTSIAMTQDASIKENKFSLDCTDSSISDVQNKCSNVLEIISRVRYAWLISRKHDPFWNSFSSVRVSCNLWLKWRSSLL